MATDDPRDDQRYGKDREGERAVRPALRGEVERQEGRDRAERDAAEREADTRQQNRAEDRRSLARSTGLVESS